MRYLTTICGHDKSARLKIIDQYDAIKKTRGYNAAWDWIESEAIQHVSNLHHVLSIVQDEAARRIIQSALDYNDTQKIKWLESRLSESMIADAAMYIGLDEDKIIAQTQTRLERRRLRFKVKQSISMINLAVGATGGKTGYAWCTPFELAIVGARLILPSPAR